MPGEAVLVKKLKKNWRGDARLYKISPPHTPWYEDEEYKYVVVSCVSTHEKRNETIIFGSTVNGKVDFKKDLLFEYNHIDHEEALRRFGYKLVEVPKPVKKKIELVEPKRYIRL